MDRLTDGQWTESDCKSSPCEQNGKKQWNLLYKARNTCLTQKLLINFYTNLPTCKT